MGRSVKAPVGNRELEEGPWQVDDSEQFEPDALGAHRLQADQERVSAEGELAEPPVETLVVCVSESPHAHHVLRRAQRMATSRHLRLFAVYVETPRYFRLPLSDRERVTQTLRLAEHLGAEVVRLAGDDVAGSLIAFASAAACCRLDYRQTSARPLVSTKQTIARPRYHRLQRQTGCLCSHRR